MMRWTRLARWSSSLGPSHRRIWARSPEAARSNVEDVCEDDGGLRLVLRRSRTGQEAEGATRGLPYGRPSTDLPRSGLAGTVERAGEGLSRVCRQDAALEEPEADVGDHVDALKSG
jgi:hypothetical protein